MDAVLEVNDSSLSRDETAENVRSVQGAVYRSSIVDALKHRLEGGGLVVIWLALLSVRG
jgi:hypothetical protein